MMLRDIFEDRDSERELHEITPVTAVELFGIFELKPVKCDKNGDGWVRGP